MSTVHVHTSHIPRPFPPKVRPGTHHLHMYDIFRFIFCTKLLSCLYTGDYTNQEYKAFFKTDSSGNLTCWIPIRGSIISSKLGLKQKGNNLHKFLNGLAFMPNSLVDYRRNLPYSIRPHSKFHLLVPQAISTVSFVKPTGYGMNYMYLLSSSHLHPLPPLREHVCFFTLNNT